MGSYGVEPWSASAACRWRIQQLGFWPMRTRDGDLSGSRSGSPEWPWHIANDAMDLEPFCRFSTGPGGLRANGTLKVASVNWLGEFCGRLHPLSGAGPKLLFAGVFLSVCQPSATICPSRISTVRCAYAAASGLCVISNIVCPSLLLRSAESFSTISEFLLSRFPVDSSAGKIAGPFAIARGEFLQPASLSAGEWCST